MNSFRGTVLTLSLSLALMSSLRTPRVIAQSAETMTGRVPVIVELFTSEGCSSCPPADVLLQQLEAQQPVAGAEIIALEEHVDYWNHDGWVDPYSSAQWTDRQQNYSTLVKQDSYTPELVVDGRSQFLGSNPQQAAAEIRKAATVAKTPVSITAEAEAEGRKRFKVSVGKLEGSGGDVVEVWLAVTEDGLRSQVCRGENAGKALQHVATLRSLQKIGVADAGAPVAFTGEKEVKFDSQWNVEHLHVTVFVQKKKEPRNSRCSVGQEPKASRHRRLTAAVFRCRSFLLFSWLPKTRRTMGVFSLYLRSLTFPPSSVTRRVKGRQYAFLIKVLVSHCDR